MLQLEESVFDAVLEKTEDVVLLKLISLALKEVKGRSLFPNPLDEPVLYTRFVGWVKRAVETHQKMSGGNTLGAGLPPPAP